MVSAIINIHKNKNIEKRREGVKDWKIPSSEKNRLLKFLDELSLGTVKKGVKISDVRLCKYLDILKRPLEYFGKTADKITLGDIKAFEKDLSSGKLITRKGKPYSHNSKVDLRYGLKTYLKWRLGNSKADKLTDWFDLKLKQKTPDYLKESEIEKLYKACKTNKERYLISLLFDAGCRAAEFHNIRYEDIQLPGKGDNYVKLTLLEEYSKTKGRVISLYWKNTLEACRDYLEEREMEGIKTGEQIYTDTYDASRRFLFRLGLKVLKKPIHYHLFRSSAATFVASKLNRQEMCYRFGWKFSSNMPDVYISRAGMVNKELDEKFKAIEMEVLQKQIDQLKFDNENMKSRLIKDVMKKLAGEKNLNVQLRKLDDDQEIEVTAGSARS